MDTGAVISLCTLLITLITIMRTADKDHVRSLEKRLLRAERWIRRLVAAYERIELLPKGDDEDNETDG